MKITRLEQYFLKRAARKAVIQGYHFEGMEAYLEPLIEASREAFTEDNRPTLRHFLLERMGRAFDRSWSI